MQLVIFHLFYSNGLKRAQADVQRDLCNFNPAGTNLREDLRSEVQAGRRRCDRAPCLGIDSLVPIPVRRPVVFAVDVGRKRHVSNALDAGEEIVDRGESDAPLPKTAALRDLGLQFGRRAGWSLKVEFFPDPDLPPGPYHALPLNGVIRHLAYQQNFDPSAEKISCRWVVRAWGLGPLPAAVAVETGRKHARIVQHK